jgi:uncharacterized protein (TIGR00162 family)
MATVWEITKELPSLPKLNNPLLIEGLPGIGNVGKITTDFLIEELKAKKLYSFFSYKFPHSVFINENNLVDMPKLEIYYKQFNSKKQDLLILTGDIQPIDEESCYTFCEEVLKIAKEFNCSEIITTGGIGLQSVPEKPKVYCTANDAQLLKEYQKKELNIEKEIFGIVGPIVGVSGILVGFGKKRSIKSVAILAETFGHPMYLGIKGAKEIIRILEKKFSFGLNMEKMSKEIVEVEKELMKRTKEWSEEMHPGTEAGAKVKKKEVGYIG